MQFLRQFQNGIAGELRDLFFVTEVYSSALHFCRAGRADAGVVGAHAVKEETVHRIVFRKLAHHVLEVFAIGGIVTCRSHFRGRTLFREAMSVGGNAHPGRIAQKLLIAEASVEIRADPDAFSMAGFGDSAEQIKLQRRMPVTVFRIIIGIALIAACMPCQKIDPAFPEVVGEFFNIEVFSDVGNYRACVKIVKERILCLHDSTFLQISK